MMPVCPRLRRYAVTPLLLVLAACAPSRFASPDPQYPVPSQVQAQRQAMGRDTGRASPQWQWALDKTPPAAADDTPLRALAQAKTFLGTIACQQDACEAARINLTLAPGGHWHARSTTLTLPARDTEEQGCWEVVKRAPLRIALRTEADTVRAQLEFTQNHVLRVITYHDIRPTLAHHLTQQAENDPVDVLQEHALTDCRLPENR